MPVPSRFTSGLSLSNPAYFLANYPAPDGPYVQSYFNDFLTYDATDWNVAAATGSTALTAGVGGLLLQTSGAVDGNLQANQLATTAFYLQAGQDMWFLHNFQMSEATQSEYIAGIANTFADITPADGIYFLKADGSTTLNLLITNTGTSTTIPVGTVAAATRYSVGFYYQGSAAVPKLTIYSTIPYGAATLTKPSPYWPGGNLPVASAYTGGTYTLANLPAAATAMTMGFGVGAGDGNARTLTTDYILAAQTVNRY